MAKPTEGQGAEEAEASIAVAEDAVVPGSVERFAFIEAGPKITEGQGAPDTNPNGRRRFGATVTMIGAEKFNTKKGGLADPFLWTAFKTC